MQTPIAQTVALTIAGNDFLHGDRREDFWPAATVFRFCKTAAFATLSGPLSSPIETAFAGDPAQWLAKLEGEGTLGLRAHYVAVNDPRMSDRLSVGFVGGGGRWWIEAVGKAVSDLWEAGWRVHDKADPERKTWAVNYRRIGVDLPHRDRPARGLDVLRDDLEDALSKIEDFAARQKQDAFAQAFRRAVALLRAEDPLARVFHADLAPGARLPLPAKQLLGAAQEGWVFGGMGSWNDLQFDGRDHEEYTALSDRLFALLNQAISEAANAGFSDRG